MDKVKEALAPLYPFGLELEFFRPQVGRLGIWRQYDDYEIELHQYIPVEWRAVVDTSCDMEVKSPKPKRFQFPWEGSECLFEEFDAICKVLEGTGHYVNDSCGLHIHIDTRSLSVKEIKKLAILFCLLEDRIDYIFPSHRIENSYCKSNRDILESDEAFFLNQITKCKTKLSCGRNFFINKKLSFDTPGHSKKTKVNFASLIKYGTIEFRQMEATFDVERVKNWVKLLNLIIHYGKTLDLDVLIRDLKNKESYNFAHVHHFLINQEDLPVDDFLKALKYFLYAQ